MRPKALFKTISEVYSPTSRLWREAAVFPAAQERQTEYLRVAVRALRQKLERDPAHPKIILNELAVGYRLVG